MNCLSNQNHMSSEFWLMVLIFLRHSCNTWNSSQPSLLCLTLSLQGHKFKARSRRLKNIFIFVYNSSENVFKCLPERKKTCPSEALVSVATSCSSLASREVDVAVVRSQTCVTHIYIYIKKNILGRFSLPVENNLPLLVISLV